MEKYTEYMENNTESITRIPINELSLPAVSDCDLLTATEGFYHMDRIADFNVLIYVTEGVMYVTEEGQDYEISSGDLLFLKSGLRHFGRYETPRGTSWIYAHFRLPENSHKGGQDMLLPKKISCIKGSATEEKLRRLCEYCHSTEPIKRIGKNALFFDILLEILSEQQPKKESLSDKICKFLDTRTDRAFSKELIENRFYLSYSHLAAEFRKEKGISMGRYHSDMQMKKASLLLRSTLMTVGEISASLGFSDMLYFSRKFHAFSGVSPTEYRKQAQRKY